MTEHDLMLAKHPQWERCKGELMAMVAMESTRCFCNVRFENHEKYCAKKYSMLRGQVLHFIDRIEKEGLHE